MPGNGVRDEECNSFDRGPHGRVLHNKLLQGPFHAISHLAPGYPAAHLRDPSHQLGDGTRFTPDTMQHWLKKRLN